MPSTAVAGKAEAGVKGGVDGKATGKARPAAKVAAGRVIPRKTRRRLTGNAGTAVNQDMRRNIAGRKRKMSPREKERAPKVRLVEEKVAVPAKPEAVEAGTRIAAQARESLGLTRTLAEIVAPKVTGRKIAERKAAALMKLQFKRSRPNTKRL